MGCLLASTAPHGRSVNRSLPSFSKLTLASQAKKAINYAVDSDSDQDEDEQDVFIPTRKERASKRRKTSVDSDEDIFVGDHTAENGVSDEGKSAGVY